MDLRCAIDIAVMAHQGVMDKSGDPYILHPVAVMNSVDGVDAQVVAILHDVVEDTEITLDDLWALTPVQRAALDAITRRDYEVYWDYILRVNENPLAAYVKNADLLHNMSPSRMAGCNKSMMDRYKKSLAFLRGE